MISARSIIGLGMCAAVSLAGSNAAFAQAAPAAAPAGTVSERLTALEEKTTAPGLWKTLGFQISGTALVSYQQNFNNPQTNNTQLRSFDTDANSFMANLAQIMFERPANADGTGMDRVGFRARINFGADARYSRARTDVQPGAENTELDVQELYGEYIAPVGNGLKIQAGKINTLIGYEVINAWENPNFSRTFMFGFGQAFTTTGVRFTYPFNDMVTATIGLINGWDNIDDNNRGKSFEYLLALTPDPRFGISFYGSYGAEQSNGNSNAGVSTVSSCTPGPGCDPTAKRTVVGSLITVKPTDQDTIILEPYYGNEGNAATDPGKQPAFGGNASGNARWNGIVTYITHDFNDQTQPNAFSLRVRGEIFEDAGGARTCGGGVNFAGGANTCAQSGPNPPGGSGSVFVPTNSLPGGAHVNGNAQTLWETTWTLQYKPIPQLQTRMEFRYDKSDQNAFLRGSEAVNNQQTLGFSVAYMW